MNFRSNHKNFPHTFTPSFMKTDTGIVQKEDAGIGQKKKGAGIGQKEKDTGIGQKKEDAGIG